MDDRERTAMCPCVDGSELARRIFTSQAWSVQPCVRPVSALRMTAGHNALRGSGPGQKLAFENAVARVGCFCPQWTLAIFTARVNPCMRRTRCPLSTCALIDGLDTCSRIYSRSIFTWLNVQLRLLRSGLCSKRSFRCNLKALATKSVLNS